MIGMKESWETVVFLYSEMHASSFKITAASEKKFVLLFLNLGKVKYYPYRPDLDVNDFPLARKPSN